MDDKYVKGDNYLICDRSGRKMRRSESRREWTGAIVHKDEYEARHPQDFVRARPERQVAPVTRPRQTDRFMGPLTTDVTEAAAIGEQSLTVRNTARFAAGDFVRVTLDNGDMWRVLIQEIPSTTRLIPISVLPRAVEVGATVINETATPDPTTQMG
jgi:hypothetical protein